MLLLQLSAGQGPDECARAVALCLQRMEQAVKRAIGKGADINMVTVQAESGTQPGCLRSVLLTFTGADALPFASAWQGTMQWQCVSPYRPQHKRKNWFFDGVLYPIDDRVLSGAIRYKTCRASGAGGQHVNTTDSAVIATHIDTGIQVRVESERSQHANKRIAQALIAKRLQMQQAQRQEAGEQQRRMQHFKLQRGQASKVFVGPEFVQR